MYEAGRHVNKTLWNATCLRESFGMEPWYLHVIIGLINEASLTLSASLVFLTRKILTYWYLCPCSWYQMFCPMFFALVILL